MKTAIEQSTPSQRGASAELLLCSVDDLIADSGVCTLVQGQQIAVFLLPALSPAVYAIGNYDPIGKANVLSRGMVGDVQGEPVVASPLYKQHFSLRDGHCLEDSTVSVPAYKVVIRKNNVYCCLID